MAILNNLLVRGSSRLLDKLYCNDVQIAGTATFASITATGAISGATLTTTGNASIGGTLGVTGAATFSSTLSATGNITSTANLYATGGYLYLAGKAVMDGGKTSANWITINNGQFSSGTYIKGTLKTDTANITNLTATSASFSGDVTVNGVLNSTEMQTNIVKAVGGQLYVSPTYIPSVNGTILCTGATTTYVTFTISDSTSITGLTYGGANWYSGSKIMFTGVITGNKGGNPQVVFASVPGELTANMNSTANKLQIKVYYDKASTYFESSNTNLTYSDMSVMMYQINSSGTLYPIGIYIKAYGNDNKNSYIDIYGGTTTTPNARLGLLTGVPNMSNGTAPSGWGIYTSNGYFNGVLVSNSGVIGGWEIGTSYLRNGTLGSDNSIWLLTSDREAADYKSIGGSSSLGTWRIAAGSKFGVTKTGDMYCNSGKIGGWSISTNTLSIGDYGADNSTYLSNVNMASKSISGRTGSDWRFTIGSHFGVTNTGAVYTNSGVIGGWNIATNTLSKNTMGSGDSIWLLTADQSSATSIGGSSLSTWRLTVGDNFGVDKNGVLYCNSGSFTGEIHASSGSTFGDITGTHISITQGAMSLYQNTTEAMHFGYDTTGNAPYLTIGSRMGWSIGTYSVGIGYQVGAQGQASFAQGYQSYTLGNYSQAWGRQTMTGEYARYAHAEGFDSRAHGSGSHAEGLSCSAGAPYSDFPTYSNGIGEWVDTPGYAGYNHAEGHSTEANGEASHAEGYGCNTYGSYSHAEGYNTKAYGNGSHVEGNDCIAYGENVHLSGTGLVGTANDSMIIGRYNVYSEIFEELESGVQASYDPPRYDAGSNYSFVIGNGTSSTRSNALTVDWSGNLVASGSLTGASLSISGTTAKVNNSDILTKASVINNLTTSTTNVPLSAAQGKALKDTLDTVGVLSATNGSNINLTANTEVTICTLSLSAGTYICTGDVHWPSSSTDAVKKLRVKASNGAYATQQVRTQWYTETNATLIFTSNSACTLSLTAESAIALTGSSGILRAIRVK